MHSRESSILATLRAIQGFLDDNKDALAPVGDSGARKSLDTLVQQLTTQAVDQDAGLMSSRGETSLQASLRTTLRVVHMKRIATIARARLGDVPEMRSFLLPRASTSSIRLAAMAGGMADAAAKHSAVFIDRGLPPDFIAQLTTAADALNQSLDTRAKSRGRSAGATTALTTLGTQARKVIKELDVLITPMVERDGRLLGEWRSAKRIREKSGPATRSSTPASVTVPSTAPAASPEEKPGV